MPDRGYRILIGHLTALRTERAQLQPHQTTAQARYDARIKEAKEAIRAHVRAQVAKRSPER